MHGPSVCTADLLASAAATLAYQYTRKTALLDLLHEDDEPATHDLCPLHADRLTVPSRLGLFDQRVPVGPVLRRQLTAGRS